MENFWNLCLGKKEILYRFFQNFIPCNIPYTIYIRMYSIIEKRNERIRVEKIWKMFSIWICFRLKKKEILAFRSNSVRGWTIRGESVCSAGGLQSRFRRDKQKKNGCAIRGEARRCLMSPQTSLSLDNHRLMHVPTPCFFFFFFFFFLSFNVSQISWSTTRAFLA